MNKHYDSPSMEIEKFTSNYVITTSGGIGEVVDEVDEDTTNTNSLAVF